jgi:hypothetical protein
MALRQCIPARWFHPGCRRESPDNMGQDRVRGNFVVGPHDGPRVQLTLPGRKTVLTPSDSFSSYSYSYSSPPHLRLSHAPSAFFFVFVPSCDSLLAPPCSRPAVLLHASPHGCSERPPLKIPKDCKESFALTSTPPNKHKGFTGLIPQITSLSADPHGFTGKIAQAPLPTPSTAASGSQ